jgi:hypothetical protein
LENRIPKENKVENKLSNLDGLLPEAGFKRAERYQDSLRRMLSKVLPFAA